MCLELREEVLARAINLRVINILILLAVIG